MKKYYFKDVLIMNKKKVLVVENDMKERVGFIKKADMVNCEKGHAFSFSTNNDDRSIQMGIQKRRIKDLLVPTYLIHMEGRQYNLRDKPIKNLLYFCVEGDIDGQSIKIEENWNGHIEVRVDDTHIATIELNEFTFKTTIYIANNIVETSILFAVTILMYFMFKIYKDESEFIQELLFN